MTIFPSFVRRFACLMLLALPIGCAEGSRATTGIPGAPLTQMNLPAAGIDVLPKASAAPKVVNLAVTNAQTGSISIYSSSGRLLSFLGNEGANSGIASDIAGDVFVVEQKRGISRVREYTRDLNHTIATFDVSGENPAGVDSFNNGKVVAVTNLGEGTAGSVDIFAQGKPVRKIRNPALAEALFCAFDAAGNLYLDGLDGNFNSILGEIPNAASGGGTYVPLTTSNTILAVGSIQVTTAGAIAIQDGTTFGAIYTYEPPTNGSLGSPISTTPIDSPNNQFFSGQVFAFTPDMSHLYEANSGYGNVIEYAYPAGGQPVFQIPLFGAGGVTTVPAQYPKSQ